MNNHEARDDELVRLPRATSFAVGGSVRSVLGACVLALALGVILVGALWTYAYHEWIGKFSDSIAYLLFADYYHGARVGHYGPAIEQFYRTTRFPPLFGWLLAAFGAGSGKVQLAVAVTQVTVVLAGIAIAAYLVRHTRDLLSGALLLVPIALCTGPFIIALDPVSEPLFACLVYAALAAAPNTLHRAVAPALFALAPLVRAIGVCAAPALALWYWRSAPPGRRLRRAALGLLTLVPFLLWTVYRRANPASESYLSSLNSEDLIAPLGGWLGLLASQPQRIFMGFVDLFDPSAGAVPIALVGVTLAAAVIGGVVRWRRNELDVQFACAYLAVVLIWPYPVEVARLLSVLLPIVLLCAWEGWRALCANRLLAAHTSSLAGWLPVLLASLLPLVAGADATRLAVKRALAPVPDELQPYMRSADYLRTRDEGITEAVLEIDARVRYAIESLPQYVPADDCVYSLSPLRSGVYGHRFAEVMPSEFDPKRDARTQFPLCRYLLITLETRRQTGEPVYFPMQHVEAITTPVFVSRFEVQGRPVLAAMLVRFND